MLRYLCCLLTTVLLSSFSLHGQIWVENFDGLPNGTQQNAPAWTTNANNCDDGGGFPGTVFGNYWGVFNGVFFVNDVEGFNCVGTGGDNQNTFLTETIDISAYACVRITVDLDANGDLECDFPAGPSNAPDNSHDQMVVEYNLNGAGWTLFPVNGYVCGTDFPPLPATAQADNLTGNTLQIRISAGNKANGEEYTFDNITVTDVSTTPTLPTLGPYCASDSPVSLNTNLSGVTGNWSGPGVTGNVFTPANAGGGSHTLTFTPAPGQCASPDNITVTVNGATANPPTQPVNLCYTLIPPALLSDNIDAIENEITGGAPGLTVNWYTDAAGTNAISPDNLFSLIPPPTTVYATVTDGTCESTTVPVSVTYNTPPNATNQQDNTCDNGDGTGTFDLTTLNSSVAGGAATVLWYADAALTLPINNPGSYTTPPTTVYAVVQGNNGCNSQPAEVTLVVDPLPDLSNTDITVNPSTSCGPTGLISLQFTLPGGTYDAVIEYGNDMVGFQTFNATSVQNNSIIQFGGVTSTFEYRLLSLSNDNGCVVNFMPPITAVVTVTQADDLPPIPDVTACGSYTLPGDAGGVPIDNYFTAPGGSGTSYTPGQAVIQTTTLYAVTGSVPDCFDEESFLLTITAPPDLQPAGTATLCSGASIDLNSLVVDAANSGQSITFHSATPPTPGNLLPSPVVTPGATTTYYAFADGGVNCTDELPITVQVTPAPTANNAGPLQECADNGTAIFDLTSLNNTVNGGSGATVNWYSDPGLTNAILSPGAFSSGGATVFAAVTSNGCESAAVAVQLEVLLNPTLNTPLPAAAQCADPVSGTATFNLTAFNGQVNNQPGTTVTWFSDPGAANPIAGPGSFTINANTTVYAFVSNGACTAGPAALPLQVLQPPVANPPNIPDFCETANDLTTVNLTAYNAQVNGGTGNTVTWYLDAAANNPILNPTNFTTGSATIYVTVDNGACASAPLSVTITVLDAPVANDAGLQACETANGQAIFNLTDANPAVNNGTGLPVDWFLDPGATNPINNPGSFSAPNNTIVFAVVDNGFCQSAPAQVQLQVLPAPPANTASLSACEENNGAATFDLTQLEPVVNGGTGLPVDWFLDANATTPIGSPGSFTTPTVTVFATVSNGPCTSVPVAVNLTVEPAPTTNTAALTACADNSGQAIFDLTLADPVVNGGTGLTVNWYSDADGNNPIPTPGSFLSGSATVFATVSNTACESLPVAVTLTAAPGPQLSAIDILSPVLCNGDDNASIAPVVSGGSPPYTYDWNVDAFDGLDLLTGLGAGTYALTIIDDNGCADNASITLTDPPVLTLTCTALTPVSAPGAADGTAGVTFGGGTAPYTIEWNGPVAGSSTETAAGTLPLNGLPPGLYTVTLTDDNGCTETCSFTINDINCNLALNANGTDPTCNGQANGAIDLTVTGGTPPFDYDWNVDALDGVADPTGLTAGDYSVVVTDDNGCSLSADITLNQPAPITLNCGQAAAPSNPGVADGQAQIIIEGGTGPYNLLWSGPIVGNTTLATSDTLLIDNLPAGNYVLQLFDDNGCQQTCQFTITDPACSLTAGLTGTDPSCAGASDGTLDLTVTNATDPITYDWNVDALDGTEDPSGLSAGLYTVLVTDGAGCTANTSFTLTEPTALDLSCAQESPVTNIGGSDGVATIDFSGGTPPYSLNWSGAVPGDTSGLAAGSLLIPGLSTGTYSLTLIDANGCIQTCVFTIGDLVCNLTLQIDGMDVSCPGDDDGAIDLTVTGGTLPFDYDWNVDTLDGIADPTGLSAGDYSVVVTDDNGCSASADVTLNEPGPIMLTCGQAVPPSQPGAADGEAQIVFEGGTAPYELFLTGPVTIDLTSATADTLFQSGLPAGDYTVQLFDANGCEETCQFTITDPPCSLSVALAGTDPTCNGQATGAVDLTVTGGTPPFDYDWNVDTLAGIADPTGLAAGDYSVIVTDGGGCSATAGVTLNEPDPIALTCGQSASPSIPGAADGQAQIAFEGGTAPYELFLTGPVTIDLTSATADTLFQSGLPAGDYTVQLFDANGCEETCQFTVTDPGCNLSITLAGTDPSCAGSSDGSLDLTVINPIDPVTYDWNTDTLNMTADPTGLSAGVYTIIVSDAAGCTADTTVTLVDPPVLSLSCAEESPETTFGGNDGVAAIDFSGGTPPYSLNWSGSVPGDTTVLTAGSLLIQGLSIGTYSLTLTDANGCVQTCVFFIGNLACNLTLQADAMNETCPGVADGAIELTINDGSAPFLIDWNTDALDGTEDPSGLTPGNYSVIVTDDNRCTDSASIVISTSFSQPEVVIAEGGTICAGDCFPFDLSFSGTAPFRLAYQVTVGVNIQNDTLVTNDPTDTLFLCADDFGLTDGQLIIEFLTVEDANCDRTLDQTKVVTVTPLGMNTLNPTLCPGESLSVNGTLYDQNNPTGTEILDGAAANGCDSILNVELDFFPPAEGTLSPSLCPGGSLTVNGTLYDQDNPTGTEILGGASSNGCDSILTVELSFFEPATGTLSTSLCPGESLSVNGTLYDQNNPTGTEILGGASSNGCDSILTVELSFFEPATGTLSTTLCPGESLTVNGTLYDENNPTGTEILDGASSNGCDSILTVELEFFPPAVATLNPLLCPGDSLVVGGEVFGFFRPAGTVVLSGGSSNGCDSTVTVELEFLDGISGTLEADTLICAGETTLLTFQLDGSPSYDVIFQAGNNPPETLTGINDGFTRPVTPTETTTYTILAILAGGSDCPPAIGDPVTIRVNDLGAEASLSSDYGGYGVSCPESTDGAAMVAATAGQSPYTYLWSNGAANTNSEGLAPGVYAVTVSDQAGCTAVDSVTVDAPPALFVEASGRSPVCFGEANGGIRIDAIAGGVPPFEFSTDGRFFGPAGDLPLEIPDLTAGSYTLYVQDLNDCRLETTVTVPAAPQLQLDLGADQTIQLGDSLLLGGFANFDVDSVVWTPAAFLRDSTANTTLAYPLRTTTYRLTAFDANGCQAADQVTIIVETDRPVYIPSAFSPDGDGINDRLLVFGGTGITEVEVFRIFDRWGDLLHEAKGFQPGDRDFGWDGSHRGQPLNAGVYVFYAVVKFVDGKSEVFQGEVLLVR